MAITEKIKAFRKKGIGGSDVGAILGVSPYKTAKELWAEKTGINPDTGEETPVMRFGNFVEPFIIDEYGRITGREVIANEEMIRHKDFPFLYANLDAYFREKKEKYPLELKCLNLFSFKDIVKNGLPAYYYAQLQHYMYILGKERGAFAIMDRNSLQLNHFDVKINKKFQRVMLEKIVDFWDCVEIKEPPEEVEDPEIELPDIDLGKEQILVINDNAELDRLCREYQEMKDGEKLCKSIAKNKKGEILKITGDAKVIKCNAGIIHNITCKGKEGFDKKSLELEHPDIFKRFVKTGEPYKMFKFYAKKGE